MPYITEEVWQRVKPGGELICHAPYPKVDESRIDETVEAEMGVIMDTTVAIRNIRGEHVVKPSQPLSAHIYSDDDNLRAAIDRQLPFINKLANVTATLMKSREDRPENSGSGVAGAVEVFVDLSGLVDKDDRLAKTKKELAKVEKEISTFTKKLSNKKFIENAPPEVVEKNRAKLEEYKSKAGKLEEHLRQLT
jgi:valyl-tRNA synthetase